jgi:hypothetical protein
MGLEILTGLSAGFEDYLEDSDIWNTDAVWNTLRRADYTPICIESRKTVSTLKNGFVYTVMTTITYNNGTE